MTSSVRYRVPGLGLPESRYTGQSGCPVVPGHPVNSVVRWYVRTRMSLSLCTVYLLQRQTDTETEHRTAERQTTDPCPYIKKTVKRKYRATGSAPFILPGVRYTGQTGLAAGNRYPTGHPVPNTTVYCNTVPAERRVGESCGRKG